MGEKTNEVLSFLRDIKEIEVDIFTSGQYLRPSQNQAPVIKHRSPEWFESIEQQAELLGIKAKCGPLVRSSYMAETLYR